MVIPMQVNYTGLLGPLRWGVGKLVCDARKYTDRCGDAAQVWPVLAGLEITVCRADALGTQLTCSGEHSSISNWPAPRAAHVQGPSGAPLLPQRHGQRAAQARPPATQWAAGAAAVLGALACCTVGCLPVPACPAVACLGAVCCEQCLFVPFAGAGRSGRAAGLVGSHLPVQPGWRGPKAGVARHYAPHWHSTA